MGIRVIPERCIGCGSCILTCPLDMIGMVGPTAYIKEGCNLCGACRDACNSGAIVIEAPKETLAADDSYHGVWVFAEQRDGKLKNVSYELLARGRELANDLKTELCAVCFGDKVADTDQLIAHGADKVYLVDDAALARDEELYARQLAGLIQEHKPEVVIAGATALGRSFFPRVAAVLKTGLTADCTGLDIDIEKKLLVQTRPTFGGNVMATIICPSKRPQMATVRPRVFKKNTADNGRKGQIIKVDFKKESITSKTRLINFVEEMKEQVKIEEADIIVSGGRGLGRKENFALIEALAKAMGAAVGSSRPPVDDGWMPYAHQVGQTGKTVCPKLYIACGISGAVQHLAGMQTSDVIVAINNDPTAPIFEVCTYGIVGDLFQVVPMMIEKLKNR